MNSDDKLNESSFRDKLTIDSLSKPDERLAQAVMEITKNHRKIIDDWCKAYLAQLYQEGHELKPGNFILNEQDVWEGNKYQKKYWFTPKEVDDAT